MNIGDVGAILLLAGAPAIASLVGGLLSLVHRPSTLLSSIIYGFAGGGLLGTVGFEMLPRGVELAGLWPTVAAFGVGFALVYIFDLIVHRGQIAGEHAQQRRRVEMAYRRRPPHGGAATVLAGATSLEEIVEGLTIGVSVALAPAVGLVVALAIVLDNLSEGLAIGQLFRDEAKGDVAEARRKALGWTATIGLALFVPALIAWFVLRDISDPIHGMLVASGAGAMLYLTLSDLLPEGQERQYQQSAALAAGASMAVILVLSTLAGG